MSLDFDTQCWGGKWSRGDFQEPYIASYIAVGAGASATTATKDRERKRHHDGHTSKGNQAKKLKQPLSCPSSGKVDLFSEDGTESIHKVKAKTDTTGLIIEGSLRSCKGLVDKVLFPCLFCLSFCFSFGIRYIRFHF